MPCTRLNIPLDESSLPSTYERTAPDGRTQKTPLPAGTCNSCAAMLCYAVSSASPQAFDSSGEILTSSQHQSFGWRTIQGETETLRGYLEEVFRLRPAGDPRRIAGSRPAHPHAAGSVDRPPRRSGTLRTSRRVRPRRAGSGAETQTAVARKRKASRRAPLRRSVLVSAQRRHDQQGHIARHGSHLGPRPGLHLPLLVGREGHGDRIGTALVTSCLSG